MSCFQCDEYKPQGPYQNIEIHFYKYFFEKSIYKNFIEMYKEQRNYFKSQSYLTSHFIVRLVYIINNDSLCYPRKILAAACENKCLMLFDPVTQKYITSIKKAHNDCVNCIK